MSALALAHIGDCVYELMARNHAAVGGAGTSRDMHRDTVLLVRAETQAAAAHAIFDLLSEDERGVFLRGRNAKPKTVPKHADRGVYSMSTALEALFGWLYLNGQKDRLNELFNTILECDQTKGG